ncbi:DUF262 domain-containing protein [Macrococcoides caseolyticum subsp. hominis]|uniref:DUF262 domain-containing protein n=1 Tax=Macrococcoides caseolyticum TaxID=69966 RepID=UPI000C15F3ED|nr:DUF262 domain-containing protein [Macrococcus caseolyticus]RAI79798.1 DUF262 domain-containing protein [Macrococcus caseolyticus subsp. hominis]
MEDSLRNLSVLFRDTLFRIPDYQRGYAWTKKNVEDFWNDLSNIDKLNNKEHYAGVLTTQPIPQTELKKEKWNNDIWLIEKKNYSPIYIVDGQQRLTTAILLITAILKTIRKKFPDITELNYTSLESIEERYLYEKKGSTNTYSCIFGYEPNDSSNDYYSKEILGIPNFGKEYRKTKYSENMHEAYTYFCKKLEKFDLATIEEYFSIITTNVVFNMYQISDKLDVFVTFETMNNRGKTLSRLELLKNRLIYLTTVANKDETDPYKDINTRNVINESWKIVYSYLGKNEKEMLDDEDFLSAHMRVYTNPNKLIKEKLSDYQTSYWYSSENILLDEIFTRSNLLKNEITLDEIIDFAQNLSENSKIWYELNNPEDSDFSVELCEEIYKYKLLLQPNYSFRLALLERNLINLFRVFQSVNDENTRILYVRYLNKVTLYKYLFEKSELLYKPISDIDKELSISNINRENINKATESIKKIIRNSNNQSIIIDEIKNQIKLGSKSTSNKRISFYDNSRFPTKYLLKSYELFLLNNNLDDSKSKEKKKEIVLGDSFSIEHVFPQRGRNGWEKSLSRDYDKDEQYNIKNSLGNLVFITTLKNQKLGTKDFNTKKGTLGNKVGFINGNYSEREIAQNDIWTDKEILERGLKLITFYLDLLNIPKCNKTIKKEMLGLSFL